MTITPEQRQELRKRWVEALRSGKYVQGKGCLEEHGKNCCLGVLCRVFDGMHPGVISIMNSDFRPGAIRFDNKDGIAPQPVAYAIGLRKLNGSFGNTSLTELNDTGKSFSEIADLIESQPAGLFVDEPATVTV